MTCIVALVENGVTYFAGDSLVVTVPSSFHSRVSQTVRNEAKIWARDTMLFGGNGAVRMLQLLRYNFEIPIYDGNQSKVAYLAKQFVPALQACFKQHEYTSNEIEGSILLSIQNELFTVGEEWGVCNTADPYEAVGKASEVAIGSLHTTAQLAGLLPLERLYLALLATEHHTCVVSQPFMYITSEMEEPKPLLSKLQEIQARKAGLAEIAHIAEDEGMYG